MALSLMKGPVVKKLMVLLLLTFSGLGYPPDLAEARECLKCEGEVKDDKQVSCDKYTGNGTISCKDNQGCMIIRKTTNGNGIVQKSCQSAPKPMIECLQEKLFQSGGPCYKMSVKNPKHMEKHTECEKKVAGKQRQTGDVEGVEGPEARDVNGYELYEYCLCEWDQCNKEDLRTVQGEEPVGGDKGTGDKGTGGTCACTCAGHLLTPSGLMAGLTGAVITGILAWTWTV